MIIFYFDKSSSVSGFYTILRNFSSSKTLFSSDNFSYLAE